MTVISGSLPPGLQIQGFDVNTGATYMEYATTSGKQIAQQPWNDGYTICNVSVAPRRNQRQPGRQGGVPRLSVG